MTVELGLSFTETLGTGSGPTRLAQLRELAIIGGLPMADPIGRQTKPTVNMETINALKQMRDDEWQALFVRYREGTKGQAVRLSLNGLNQIRKVISNFEVKI